MEKDDEISNLKREKPKSIELKAKHSKALTESDDDSSKSCDEDEYTMVVKEFKKFFWRRGRFVKQPKYNKPNTKRNSNDKKCFRCGDPNHFIGDWPKPLKHKKEKAFVGGAWSDSGEND